MTDAQSIQSTEPSYFTVKRIAERWDSSEKHVRRLVQKGVLPACRFGNMLRIGADGLFEFERSHRIN